MADFRDTLMNALEAAPRPVTDDSVMAIAGDILPGKELREFQDWWKKYGSFLLVKLNG